MARGARSIDPRRHPRALVAAVGVAAATLTDAGIPLSVLMRAWEEAERLSGDPAFGLHLAERVEMGAFGLVDHLIRNAPTLGEAFARMSRYLRLLQGAVVIRLDVTPDRFVLRHHLDAPPLQAPRAAAQLVVATCLRRARALTGVEVRALEAGFQHAPPADVSEYARVLGRIPIHFGAEENTLTLPRLAFDLPVMGGDPRLGEMLARHAEPLLAARPPVAEPLVARARRALTDELRNGSAPTLSSVAGALRMSDRTLQRHLTDAGTSLKSLLDDTRHALARRYLKEEGLPVAGTSGQCLPQS